MSNLKFPWYFTEDDIKQARADILGNMPSNATLKEFSEEVYAIVGSKEQYQLLINGIDEDILFTSIMHMLAIKPNIKEAAEAIVRIVTQQDKFNREREVKQ